MKKQGDAFFKILSIVTAVLLGSYLLFSVLFRSGSSYATEPAVLCEVGDGITVSGFVVRSETVLRSSEQLTVCECAEGEWIGAGQTVATAYRSAQARQLRRELASLESQLEQLQYAAGGTGSDAAALDAQIRSLLTELSAQSARQDPAMHSAAAELEPLLLRSGVSTADEAELNERIETLQSRIEILRQSTAQGAGSITAPVSGYYSATADGYESMLTGQTLLTLTPQELTQLAPQSVPSDSIGCLSTGQKWYFAAVISEERAQQCRSRSYLTVSFAGQELRELKMYIERVGDAQDGQCVLVLSCEQKLREVTALRRQSAEITFKNYEGLRVPKSALYVVDGEAGVYILQNRMAKWKTVEILCESGEDYIVKWDDSSTANLWPQDEIILTNQNIENGMVMK